jgi:hypothetical protein
MVGCIATGFPLFWKTCLKLKKVAVINRICIYTRLICGIIMAESGTLKKLYSVHQSIDRESRLFWEECDNETTRSNIAASLGGQKMSANYFPPSILSIISSKRPALSRFTHSVTLSLFTTTALRFSLRFTMMDNLVMGNGLGYQKEGRILKFFMSTCLPLPMI